MTSPGRYTTVAIVLHWLIAALVIGQFVLGWQIYATLIALPLTGYLGSEFSGYPVKYFGVALPQWAGKHPQAKEFLEGAHLALTWLLFTLVALHLAGVAKHFFIDRDRLLARMGIGRGAATSSPPAG